MLIYAYAYDDPYVAGLTSFLCFAFCFALTLMLMLSCEPDLNWKFCPNILRPTIKGRGILNTYNFMTKSLPKGYQLNA